MSDVIRMGGGWGTAIDRMSPTTRARVEAADREYERQSREEDRERAARAAIAEEDRIRASIEMALNRGEVVDIRQAWANGGVGRTRAEALAFYSAQQDIEDARMRRQAQREIARIGELTYYEQMSADMSAPTESEKAEHRAALQAKQRKYAAAGRSWKRRAEARAVAQTEIARHEERKLLGRWSA